MSIFAIAFLCLMHIKVILVIIFNWESITRLQNYFHCWYENEYILKNVVNLKIIMKTSIKNAVFQI